MSEENRPKETAGTVERVLQIVSALADTGTEVSVKTVSDAVGLPTSTTHRLLNLLRQADFVEYNAAQRRYSVGPALYRVAARVMASSSRTAMAGPVVDQIAAEFDETVLFGEYLPAQGAVSFVYRADGSHSLTYRVEMNRPTSLVWGASGRSILAFLPPEVATAAIEKEGRSPASDATRPDEAWFDQEIATIRGRGWATSENEKLPDARGIAAPVHGPSGVVGCLCLTIPSFRTLPTTVPEMAERLVERTKALSNRFGAA